MKSKFVSILLLTISVSLFADTKTTVDRLFMQASDGAIRHSDLVQPSKDSLAAMADSAAKYLVLKLHSTDARERHTLVDIFREIGDAATPYLLKALETDDKQQLKTTARALGEVKDTLATEALLTVSEHPDYTVRSQAITSLGKIGGDDQLAERLSIFLADSVYVVRKSGTVALGRIGSESSLQQLAEALRDRHFSVRLTAYDAILKYDSLAHPIVTDLLERSTDDRTKALAVRLAGELNIIALTNRIEEFLSNESDLVRGWSAWSWGRLEGQGALDRLREMREEEPSLLAQSLIDDTIRYLQSPTNE